MDLLSKDEPLINLNGFDSPEDLLSDESLQPHHQRRLNPSKHANTSSSRQPRLSSGSKVYLRELSPVRKDQSMERQNSVIVSAVEKTMKNYADGVLRVLEGMSGRLSQLELASQDLEHSVASLKVSVDDYHEHTDENFKILNERIMEMHRGLQILRDKQDIFEAHAQLAKLQTSKALAEKESLQGSAKVTADSVDSGKGHQQQELALQVPQPQQTLPQPCVSQPQHVATQQYQVPNLQSQHLGSVQEAQVHVMQQNPKAHTPSEQVQYQSPPQQLQVQQTLPSQQPTLQVQQPLEQVRYLPVPPQMQMPQPLLQQGPSQQPLQVTTQLSVPIQQSEQTQFQSAPQQRQVHQMPPQQASVQQPIQAQQGMVTQQSMQAQQGMVTQQPPQMQPHSSSHLQGSFQYYGQPNDSPSYASLPQGTPTFVQGGYVTDTTRDSTNYVPHQRPLATHQVPQLPPMQSYQQMPPQVSQPPHDPNVAANVSGPMTWNRQTNLGTPSAAPRLQTAQLVRADHPPPEMNRAIEKVVAMGFSRDQVQSVIRRLAERNQSVDMNVVLDILMNGGAGNQGGFGR